MAPTVRTAEGYFPRLSSEVSQYENASHLNSIQLRFFSYGEKADDFRIHVQVVSCFAWPTISRLALPLRVCPLLNGYSGKCLAQHRIPRSALSLHPGFGVLSNPAF